MYNDLCTIFGLTIHGYGLMIGLGTVLCLLWAERRAKERGLDTDFLYTLFLLALIFGWSGAKLLYVITVFPVFLQDPWSVLGSEGFVVYGGILTGVATVYLLCRRHKQSFAVWADLLLPAVALAQGFGRLGCFLAGCCYGRPTTLPIGVVFPAGSFAPAGVPLLPTQLISAAGDLLLAALLARLDRRPHPAGQVGCLYLIFYSVGRFLIEFLRNDYRGEVGFLSTSQFISVGVLLAALLTLRTLSGREASHE